jgi:RND family efflux transporter MFP subunit
MNTPNASPATRRQKKYYLLGVPVLLIAGGLWLHFHRLHQADSSPPPERAPWALQTARVELGTVQERIQSVAVVDAPQQIVLSPQIAGTVLSVGPRSGVAVKAGELLVRIDARTISSNLAALEQQRAAAQAEADYASAQQTRVESVLREGGVSQAQADLARTTAEGARAKAGSLTEQMAALRVNLGYAEIRAPRDAIVAERLVEVGDTVGPGRVVYRLTAGAGAVVRVSLPAAELSRVHPGDALELQQDAAVLTIPITRVSPAVNAAGLGTVEADAPTAPFGLPSGSTVAATVLASPGGETLTVPAASLIGSGPGAYVMTIVPVAKATEPGRLRRVPVEVLQQGGARAAVRGSLAPGDAVVIGQSAVLSQLRDGDAATTAAHGGPAQ